MDYAEFQYKHEIAKAEKHGDDDKALEMAEGLRQYKEICRQMYSEEDELTICPETGCPCTTNGCEPPKSCHKRTVKGQYKPKPP